MIMKEFRKLLSLFLLLCVLLFLLLLFVFTLPHFSFPSVTVLNIFLSSFSVFTHSYSTVSLRPVRILTSNSILSFSPSALRIPFPSQSFEFHDGFLMHSYFHASFLLFAAQVYLDLVSTRLTTRIGQDVYESSRTDTFFTHRASTQGWITGGYSCQPFCFKTYFRFSRWC